MGGSKSKEQLDFSGEISFFHFKILRSIGRGAYGKVCIAMKRDDKKLYAMKYMNKLTCIQDKAVKSVINERKILEYLEHPLLVNLWFAFQDFEDMFMVLDLMLGGDLRFHLKISGAFKEEQTRVYILELCAALDYIHSKNIVHRDIKPDNILLDNNGHVHLADFNVASFMPSNGYLKSCAGTRPYMAPEIITRQEYSFGVDWWSLGVTMFEFLEGKNPFRQSTKHETMMAILHSEIQWPSNVHSSTLQFLKDLLERLPKDRIGTPNSMDRLKGHVFFSELNISWKEISEMKLCPAFIPNKDKYNCDAAYELEEIMLEDNPIHKKKKRLNSKLYQMPPHQQEVKDE